jgi:hypothetical protein
MPPPPAVTPDQVTEKNAAQQARALREEIERAAAECQAQPAPPKPGAKP